MISYFIPAGMPLSMPVGLERPSLIFAVLHRRLAELKEQLRDARAEHKADAAAYASTLESQQVGICRQLSSP